MNKANEIRARLEYLRAELRAERISTSELVELQSLAEHIEDDDIELREAAGIPEHGEKYIFTIKDGLDGTEEIEQSFENEADAIEWADLYLGESYGIRKANQ